MLGLPGEGVPYLIPMSCGFDGESLYFSYVLGAESRKAVLTGGGTAARFLVYRVDTAFDWESALLTGTIEAVRRHRGRGTLPVPRRGLDRRSQRPVTPRRK